MVVVTATVVVTSDASISTQCAETTVCSHVILNVLQIMQIDMSETKSYTQIQRHLQSQLNMNT